MYVNRDHTYISFENPFSHHHVFSCNSSTHIQLMCVYVRLDSYCIHLFWRPFSTSSRFFLQICFHTFTLLVCVYTTSWPYIHLFWRSFFFSHMHVSFWAIFLLKVLFCSTYTRLFFSYISFEGPFFPHIYTFLFQLYHTHWPRLQIRTRSFLERGFRPL